MTFEEFKKNLRSMNFLSVPAVEYPLMIAEALEEKYCKDNSSSDRLDCLVPFLALTVLLQYSCQGQNVCLNLGRETLQSLTARIRENNISACRNKRIFPPEEPDSRNNALKLFDSFWKETFGSDFENVESFTRSLVEKLRKKDRFENSSDAQGSSKKNNDPLLSLVRFENDSNRAETSADDSAKKSSDKDGNSTEPVPYVLYCDEKQKLYSLYYSRQFACETFIADCIRARRDENRKIDEEQMKKICGYLNILFDENNYQQKTAAFLSCLSRFFIITGGPGTGKTTTVVKLLLLLRCLRINENLNIGMAAPTGKAAARMKESIHNSCHEFSMKLKEDKEKSMLYKLADMLPKDSEGNQKISAEELVSSIPSNARTIHQLIGINFSEHTVFNRNNPLPYNVLIVDEASMMDLSLFYKLLQSVSDECQIILLGDQNQLPSVEGGSVFADLCRAFLENSKTESDINEEDDKGKKGKKTEKTEIIGLFKKYILSATDSKEPELSKAVDRKLPTCPAYEETDSMEHELNNDAENWFKDNASSCAARLTENHRFRQDDSENSIKKVSDWVNSGGQEGIDIPEIEIRTDSVSSLSVKDVAKGVYAINLEDQFKKNFNSTEVGNGRISNKTAEEWLKKLLSGLSDSEDSKDFRKKLEDWCNLEDCCENRKDLEIKPELKGYKVFWETVKYYCDNHFDLSRDADREKADKLFQIFNNFRVLCTNRETVFGVNSVNSIYHDICRKSPYFNRNAAIKGTDGLEWYPGLPIMITKNNYSLHLYNGDIGITMVDPDSQESRPELKVLFPVTDDSSEVSYRYFPASVLSDCECAYAITVHKSQGSEMNHVLMLTQNRDSSFITREILYTGITRARSSVTLVYEPDLFRNQCSRQISRCSNLQSRINI